MTGSGSPPLASVRRTRRVQDMIFAAVHRACDQGQLELASRLLRLGEQAIATEADLRRRRQDLWGLIAAHERLWYLRHDSEQDGAGLQTRLSARAGFDMAMGGD